MALVSAVLAAASSPAIAAGGLCVGVLVGMTGMGGGALLTPLLVLGLGLPARVAVSSDLVVSLFMKPVGALTHSRKGSVRRDIVGWLAAGSVPAAFAGSVAINRFVGKNSETMVEPIIGAVLFLAAALMVVRIFRTARRTVDGFTAPALRIAPTIAIGAAGGFLVGLTSVGSGSLMLVLLSWCYPKLAGSTLVGTDLMQAVPLVASAALGHVIFGDARISLIVPVLFGALPGAWMGARLAHRVPELVLRPILALVLGASGLRLAGLI